LSRSFEIKRSVSLGEDGAKRTAETVHFCVTPLPQDGRRQRVFTEKDLLQLIVQGVLAAAVRLLPPDAWRRVCAVTSSARAASRRRKYLRTFTARVTDVLGAEVEVTAPKLFASVQRRLHERQVTCLRENMSWPPPLTEVDGIGHLEASLAAGRGAILWNTPALGDTIVTKRALAAAGHPVHQLSVRSHGFSQSPFAVRYLNPRQLAVEDRFLAGRIFFEGEETVRAMREVTRRLGRNASVMFTNSTFAGRSFVLVPFGKDFFLPLATSPMNLALKLGVPLHVVTTVETEPFRRYRTTISPDLRPQQAEADGMEDEGALARTALHVRDVLRIAVRAAADQIRLWDALTPLPSSAAQTPSTEPVS
jgi:lauroyl/myristoyl acyltransferase